MSPTTGLSTATMTHSLSLTGVGIDPKTSSRGVYLVFTGHGSVCVLSLRILHRVTNETTTTKTFQSPGSDFYLNLVGGLSKIEYVSNIRYPTVTLSQKDFTSGR
jgi:hypothetical protein